MATLQELLNAQSAVADRNRAKDWSARNRAAFGGILDVNQYLPVTGDIQSGILAAQDLNEGAYGSAALNALGLLPFVPAVGGVVKKAGKAAKTKYEIAQDVAQKNAALPISEGGLGLPANNTAMDRAKAMGAEFGWAHGSPNPNITEFRPSDIGAEGPGIYATNYLPESNTYALDDFGATVYPIAVMKEKSLNVGKGNPYEVLNAENDAELLAKLKSVGKDSIIKTQEATPQWLIDAGALPMPDRQHYVSMNPANFRSRFAAFDPMRRNEADILAGIGGASLAGLLGLSLLDQQQYD